MIQIRMIFRFKNTTPNKFQLKSTFSSHVKKFEPKNTIENVSKVEESITEPSKERGFANIWKEYCKVMNKDGRTVNFHTTFEEECDYNYKKLPKI